MVNLVEWEGADGLPARREKGDSRAKLSPFLMNLKNN